MWDIEVLSYHYTIKLYLDPAGGWPISILFSFFFFCGQVFSVDGVEF